MGWLATGGDSSRGKPSSEEVPGKYEEHRQISLPLISIANYSKPWESPHPQKGKLPVMRNECT